MPPYYPGDYQEQYPNQYQYDPRYDDPYNQYQFQSISQPQPIPPYSQIQINVPPRQQPASQMTSQYNYQQNFQPSYTQSPTQFQYQYQFQPTPQQQHPQHQQHQQQQQQQQQQHIYQYQQPQPIQPDIPTNQNYRPMSQHSVPAHQIQINIPKPSPQTSAQPQSQIQRVLKDVQPTALRQQPVTPKPTPQKTDPEPPEPDYEILLLTLADEYLDAAHKLPSRSEEYHKLTATALGCIDAVLNNFKLQPLREAQVSVKYAQLLLNETENYDDAERILTKTIDMCERLKYLDLKYGAQLLLIRVLYRSRPKAALKDLQAIIQDIEAYKHIAWDYAFRLQYVMFLVSSTHLNDNHIAVAQLERIGHIARQAGDHAVLAFAAVLEALVYLQATNDESIQSSQRALAKARALQLNPDVGGNPQICLMMEFVDLCGQIKSSDTSQGEEKRKSMQSVLYQALENSAWRSDGLMYIPINQTSLRGLQIQDSGLIIERNERYYLSFSWLTKDEVEDLGYLLSGISAAHKNAGDGGKAEKYFEEGISMIDEILEEHRPTNHIGDLMKARQLLVKCHFTLEIAFLHCSKGQWAKAESVTKAIDKIAEEMGDEFPLEVKCLADYTKAAIHQGKGDPERALHLYQSPALSLASRLDEHAGSKLSSQLHRREETIRNISILAAMNTVFIIRQPTHPQYHRLQGMVGVVDPLAIHHPNKNIQAAWNFVLASLPNNTILKTKQHLHHALGTAQGINNAQITTLCLVTMQEKFFKGVVGDQAIKCARAASHQARRLNEPMWVAAASGLEAECLGIHGMTEESARKREEMEKAIKRLPENVRISAMPFWPEEL